MSQPLRTFAFFKTNILSGCVLEGVELSTSLTGLDTGGDEQGGSAGTGDADGSRAGKADFFLKATRDNCLKIDDDFFDLITGKVNGLSGELCQRIEEAKDIASLSDSQGMLCFPFFPIYSQASPTGRYLTQSI